MVREILSPISQLDIHQKKIGDVAVLRLYKALALISHIVNYP